VNKGRGGGLTTPDGSYHSGCDLGVVGNREQESSGRHSTLGVDPASRGDNLAYRSLAPTPELHAELTVQFTRYNEPVRRYLASVFHLRAEAEEITQEVFLRLYRYQCEGGEVVNVASWVFRVARNLAVSRARHQRYALAICGIRWGEWTNTVATPDPSPEQQLIALESRAEWDAALERLTQRQRDCLHLRTEGLRYKDIAEVLDISLHGVVDALERAVGNLKKALVT
jgi:RNA polymerase sigma-70 factor (ECF subfamily)